MTTRDATVPGTPCWADLWTSDVAGTRTFYCELFGWEALDPDPSYGGYFNFSRRGTWIAGCMGDMGDMQATDTWKPYLSTADMAKTMDAAEAAGARIVLRGEPVGDLGVQGVLVDPTVDLDRHVEPGLLDRLADASDLREHLGTEGLTAEPRKNGHAQHQVDLGQVGLDGLEGRVGIGRQSDPEPEASHLGDQRRRATYLDVDGAPVRPGVAEGGQVPPGVTEHQVRVEEQCRVATEGGHHRGTDGQVGHEVPVHHIDVEPLARRCHGGGGGGQVAKVGREDRRSHVRHGRRHG